MQHNSKYNHTINTMLHTTNNKHCYNTYSLHNRRKALKKLRDLGLFSIATSFGIFSYKKLDTANIDSINLESTNKATLDSIYTQSSINTNPLYNNINTNNIESNQTIINSLFQSNIPQEFLSLPLKHFSIPHEYVSIIKANTKQNKDKSILITPLITNKYINYTNYYLNMPLQHINMPFLTYNYDSLASFLKDLESKQFYMRYYNLDSMFIEYIKDITISLLFDRLKDFDKINFLSHKITNNSIQYKEYMQSNIMQTYTIDSYNKVMDYLDDISKNSFNTDLQNNKPNPKKHREFLENLNIIGQNNIKALYVGIRDEQENKAKSLFELPSPANLKNLNIQKRLQNKKRPKFIGRLATTIIIEDGLWLG